MESTNQSECNGHQVGGYSYEVRVSAIMTAPRYEAVWARTQIEHALRECGIPLAVSGGVFYGQCMQRMLEGLMDRDINYALAIDFDSIFTANHVRRLLGIIAHEQDIDAIAAVQPMRGDGRLLGTSGRREEIVWEGYPIKVRTAHFGLTAIDLNKLAAVPKPWFISVPDPTGGWNDEQKIDDDGYFWEQWHAAGNSLYLDPGTRLGHLQEMIAIYDGEMDVKYLYPKQWNAIKTETVDYDPTDAGLAHVPSGQSA